MPEPAAGCDICIRAKQNKEDMFFITIGLTVVIIAIDFFAVRRLTASLRYRWWMVALALLCDILPIVVSFWALSRGGENPISSMMISSWAFFAYMVLCIARVPFNISVLCSRRSLIRKVGLALSIITIATLFYGMLVTRTDYEVRRITIYSSRLPKSFDGYRIVQLSDIHLGTMLSAEEELAEIVALCNAEKADMVAFCGDLVNVRYDELTPEYMAALGEIRANDGVYSVTGNHDTGVYMRDRGGLTIEENTRQLLERQRMMGWQTIEDRTEYICRGEDSIAISGVAFSDKLQNFRHSFDLPYVDLTEVYEGYNKEHFNITISHIPQAWDSIMADSLADVTLSGHIHAMQFKLPIGKRGLSPAMFGYKRWSGLYEEQDRYLYINDGIGNVLFPLRIGARPEITVITLRHSE